MSIIIRLLILIGILALLASGWWYVQQESPLSIGNLAETLTQTREVITPPPLRGPRGQSTTTLTRAGVFTETNRHRINNDLPPLAAATTLDRAAQAKLDDMFKLQYFDHVGPDGRGPSDWVEGVGYRYIRVGENLALGNFESDAALVQAWMDSPGHRANILHTGFSEIGIAVGKGSFEGQPTWLAVQTFALPQSACPQPNPTLAREIEQLQAAITATNSALQQQQTQLAKDSDTLATRIKEIEALYSAAQQKIEEGNAKIAEGNKIYRETGSQEAAQPYWDEGKQLQKEGEQLHEAAVQQQAAYNDAVRQLNTQQTTYNEQLATSAAQQTKLKQIIATYNQQVKKYNSCVQ